MSRTYETVKVEHENGIAWVTLNRPDKRNAMSPQLHYEMCDILDTLEHDPQAKVLVLTGAGDAWCAGQDLKLFFRDLDDKPVERTHAAGRQPLLALAEALHLCQADHRDGERVLLRRRLHPAHRLRLRDRGRGRAVRPVRGQLGHPAGRLRQQGAGGGARHARRGVVRRDGRDTFDGRVAERAG